MIDFIRQKLFFNPLYLSYTYITYVSLLPVIFGWNFSMYYICAIFLIPFITQFLYYFIICDKFIFVYF